MDEKSQVLLKSDKNSGYFTQRLVYIYHGIWLNSCWNKKCFRQKLYRISKHTFYAQQREKYGTDGQATDNNRIGRIWLACWITKATDKLIQNIYCMFFPRQRWLCEQALILCYTYTAYLVLFFLVLGFLRGVRSKFIDDVSETTVGSIFTGYKLKCSDK
jgi:hypothetical protein